MNRRIVRHHYYFSFDLSVKDTLSFCANDNRQLKTTMFRRCVLVVSLLVAAASSTEARFSSEWEKYQCDLPMAERARKVAWYVLFDCFNGCDRHGHVFASLTHTKPTSLDLMHAYIHTYIHATVFVVS